MARMVVWNPKEIKKNLAERLQNCIDDRRVLEYRWQENERIIYNTTGDNLYENINYSFDSDISSGDSPDQ